MGGRFQLRSSKVLFKLHFLHSQDSTKIARFCQEFRTSRFSNIPIRVALSAVYKRVTILFRGLGLFQKPVWFQ